MKDNTNTKSKSRRRTPWTSDDGATALQSFIDDSAERDYAHRHPDMAATGEIALLNSYDLKACRICGSESIAKNGLTASGMQRYVCRSCGKRFNFLTNTIFDSHKIPITEWIGFLLDIFGNSSYSLTSKVNRNAVNTTRYWMQKTFLLVKGIQDDVILEGRIWLDETFFKVISRDVKTHDDGKEYRGISRNQICIGIAVDSSGRSIFIAEGKGKPSSAMTMRTFGKHIREGSELIHDMEKSHNTLVSELGLISTSYDSREIKKLDDKDNPLRPVNELCRLLKRFLRSHPGFDRDDIQGYLDLFSVMVNEPSNKYEKVEKLLELSILNCHLLRYRDVKPHSR